MTKDDHTKVTAWGTIIFILVAAGIVAVVVAGLLASLLGLRSGMIGGGIGAVFSIVGGILIARRRTGTADQNTR